MYSARRNVNKDSTIWRSIISDFHRLRLAKAMLARTYTKRRPQVERELFSPLRIVRTPCSLERGQMSNCFPSFSRLGCAEPFASAFSLLMFHVAACMDPSTLTIDHVFLFHFCTFLAARVCEKNKRNFAQEMEEKVHGRAARIVFIFAIVWQPDLMLITFHVRECTRFPRSSTDYFFPSSSAFFSTAETKSRQRTQKL